MEDSFARTATNVHRDREDRCPAQTSIQAELAAAVASDDLERAEKVVSEGARPSVALGMVVNGNGSREMTAMLLKWCK